MCDCEYNHLYVCDCGKGGQVRWLDPSQTYTNIHVILKHTQGLIFCIMFEEMLKLQKWLQDQRDGIDGRHWEHFSERWENTKKQNKTKKKVGDSDGLVRVLMHSADLFVCQSLEISTNLSS